MDAMRGRERVLLFHRDEVGALWRKHDLKECDEGFHKRYELQQRRFWDRPGARRFQVLLDSKDVHAYAYAYACTDSNTTSNSITNN
jgi:hypothetical protein